MADSIEITEDIPEHQRAEWERHPARKLVTKQAIRAERDAERFEEARAEAKPVHTDPPKAVKRHR